MLPYLVALAGLTSTFDVSPDPAATKLLADARAARAHWAHFPGFRADITVNLDGHVCQGTVQVDAEGKVKLEGLDKTTEDWARRTLSSIVNHRQGDSPQRNTPCVFADTDTTHPHGRLIRLLNDELHSTYRIKDNLIMEVNRQMRDKRFTISVLDVKTNAEGKYLPSSYVVSTWDLKSGELLRTDAHWQSWTRVDGVDLPASVKVVTTMRPQNEAEKGLQVRSLTLTKQQLLSSTSSR